MESNRGVVCICCMGIAQSADQPEQQHSLISTFVVDVIDTTIQSHSYCLFLVKVCPILSVILKKNQM